MISDPDIWPRDFVPNNKLPGLIEKSEDEVLEAIGTPDYVVSKTDSTSYLYQNKDHDTAIMMILYIPMPFPPLGGHEINCVLLMFDEAEKFEKYEIRSLGATNDTYSNAPHGECRYLFGIPDDEHFMEWCLYEKIRGNQDLKAIEVRKEYRQYTSRSLNDSSRLQWLCRAADHGHPNAQADVGSIIFENENIDKRDLVRAYVWYSLAAQSTCLNYSLQLEKIVHGMTAEQTDMAKQLLNNWAPGQCEKDLINSIQTGNE